MKTRMRVSFRRNFLSNSLHKMNQQSRQHVAHAKPNGPGDSRPTARQIIQDEGLLEDSSRLSGKTVLITGGTSGLGLETAKAIHAAGAKVFVSGRCEINKGRGVAASIQDIDLDRHKDVQFVSMDLSDLDSVSSGANEFLKMSNNRLNILICNAGVMAPQELTRTKQNHEMQFGVNHLAHFLLFELLAPALLKSSTTDLHSRVVVVASCAHRSNALVAEGDYDFTKASYNPFTSYGQSKTANIYMANELERRFGSQGLHGLSVHPGVIMETSLVRHLTDDGKKLGEYFTSKSSGFAGECKDAQQGAASIVWAAVSSDLEGKGGLYLEDCSISEPVQSDLTEDEWYKPGRSEWCYDRSAEEKLWLDSERMISPWV